MYDICPSTIQSEYWLLRFRTADTLTYRQMRKYESIRMKMINSEGTSRVTVELKLKMLNSVVLIY